MVPACLLLTRGNFCFANLLEDSVLATCARCAVHMYRLCTVHSCTQLLSSSWSIHRESERGEKEKEILLFSALLLALCLFWKQRPFSLSLFPSFSATPISPATADDSSKHHCLTAAADADFILADTFHDDDNHFLAIISLQTTNCRWPPQLSRSRWATATTCTPRFPQHRPKRARAWSRPRCTRRCRPFPGRRTQCPHRLPTANRRPFFRMSLSRPRKLQLVCARLDSCKPKTGANILHFAITICIYSNCRQPAGQVDSHEVLLLQWRHHHQNWVQDNRRLLAPVLAALHFWVCRLTDWALEMYKWQFVEWTIFFEETFF